MNKSQWNNLFAHHVPFNCSGNISVCSYFISDTNVIRIGGTDLKSASTWEWTNYSQEEKMIQPTFWGPNQSNNYNDQDCLSFYKFYDGYALHDEECPFQFQFMCEKWYINILSTLSVDRWLVFYVVFCVILFVYWSFFFRPDVVGLFWTYKFEFLYGIFLSSLINLSVLYTY